MPVDIRDVLDLLRELAEKKDLRVTATESLKGGLITGVTAVAGGLVGGPVGLAAGEGV